MVFIRVLLVSFLFSLCNYALACRIPASITKYSINVDGKKIGEMSQRFIPQDGGYLAREDGVVKFLFLKDTYSYDVDGDLMYGKGFVPIEAHFKDSKRDRSIARDLEVKEYDALSYQLQVRYHFLNPKSPLPRQVWIDRELFGIKFRVRPAKYLYVPFFKRDLRVIPVKYKMDGGISGTLWFAPKVNYLLVKRKQVTPSSASEGVVVKGSVVVNELLSYKPRNECLVK